MEAIQSDSATTRAAMTAELATSSALLIHKTIRQFISTVTVMTRDRSFTVQRSILVRSSDVFAAALSERWAGTRTQDLDLSGEESGIVALYLQWAHYENLSCDTTRASRLNEEALIRLYIFADKYDTARLRGAILKEMKALLPNCGYSQPAWALAFSSLPEKDPLLLLLTSWFRANCEAGDISDSLLQSAPRLLKALANHGLKPKRRRKVEAELKVEVVPEVEQPDRAYGFGDDHYMELTPF